VGTTHPINQSHVSTKPLHWTEPLIERNHAGHHCIKRQILFLWKLNLLQILSVRPLCRRDRFPGHYQDQVIYVSTVSSESQLVPDWDKVRHHQPQYTTHNNKIIFYQYSKSFQPIRGIRAIHRIETLDSKRLLIKNNLVIVGRVLWLMVSNLVSIWHKLVFWWNCTNVYHLVLIMTRKPITTT
jgi:hypothetical protein